VIVNLLAIEEASRNRLIREAESEMRQLLNVAVAHQAVMPQQIERVERVLRAMRQSVKEPPK
jgi:hypothetical protein